MTRKEAIEQLAEVLIQEQVDRAADEAEEYEEDGMVALKKGDFPKACEKFGLALMYKHVECGDRQGNKVLLTDVMHYLDGVCPNGGPESVGWELRAAVQSILTGE